MYENVWNSNSVHVTVVGAGAPDLELNFDKFGDVRRTRRMTKFVGRTALSVCQCSGPPDLPTVSEHRSGVIP
jgi:hypothetical protein